MSVADLTVTGAWQTHAACVGVDPDLFYPERGEDSRPAKAVCAECIVATECLEYALANRETYGIWGGRSENQREQIRKERRAAGQLNARQEAAEQINRRVLAALQNGATTCTRVAELTAITRQSVRHSLHRLRDAGLVHAAATVRVNGSTTNIWALGPGDVND